MSNDLLAEHINHGASLMSRPLTAAQAKALAQYVQLLAKWNQAYNLTAVRDPQQMVSRHILDSLSIAPHIQGETILDVGSGPGLPGIPLAILYPDRRFTTLDSNGKKTRFMTQARIELGLKNLTVVHDRVESYRPEQPFETITSRAFSSLSDMVAGTRHLLADTGVYLAMKGLYPEEELRELTEQSSCELIESITLEVPGCDGERHLVILRNKH